MASSKSTAERAPNAQRKHGASRDRVLAAALSIGVSVCLLIASPASAETPVLVNSNGEALIKNHFTSTDGAATFETKGGEKMTCSDGSESGEFTSESNATGTARFTGCEMDTKKCETSGAKEGEVVANTHDTLVFTDKELHEAGLLTKPEEVAVECACPTMPEKVHLKGSVVAKTTPVDDLVEPSGVFTLNFTQAKGIQEPTKFENGQGESLESFFDMEGSGEATFVSEQTGFATTGSLLLEEAAEIRVEKWPIWFVNGNRLAAIETITAKTVAGKSIKLKNNTIEVECQTATGRGEIENINVGGGALHAFAALRNLKFEMCTVTKPAEKPGVERCIVETGEIKPETQLAFVQWKAMAGEEAVLDFDGGANKGRIAEFTLLAGGGLACGAAGIYKAVGEIVAEIANATTPETPKKFSPKCPPIGAYFYGEGRTKITPKEPIEIGLPGILEAGEICSEFEFTLTGKLAGKTIRIKEV